jgi:hypothetical protein
VYAWGESPWGATPRWMKVESLLPQLAADGMAAACSRSVQI